MGNVLFNLVLAAGIMLLIVFPGLSVADEASGADETAAAKLAERIEKGTAPSRLEAISEAAEIASRQEKPTDGIVASLIVALSDENSDIQSAAARTLAAFGPAAEKAVPALIAQMKGFSGSSDGVLLWLDCSQALTAIGPEVVPFLLEAIGEGDDNTFKGICASLHDLGPSVAPMVADAIVDAMIKLIESETGNRRRLATYTLVPLGSKAKAAVPALVEELDDSDFHSQLIACQALTAIGPDAKPAVKKLLVMIEKGNVSVRGHAALCLGAIGPVEGHEIVPAIVKRLDDQNQVVRERAMIGLGMMGRNAATALSQVEQALDGKTFHAKPEAALAYWRISGDSRKAVDHLVKLLNEPTHELLSMQKLGEMGPAAKESVPALLSKLGSDDISVQLEACDALGRIGSDTAEVRKGLDELVAHEDVELAAMARSAIQRLNQQPNRK